MARIPTREYSKRLGPLSAEQLQAALDRFDLGELRSASPVAEGLFGQNVFVNSTRGKWVLRGAPLADWQLPRERFFAERLDELGALGAPWPYWLEDSPDLFGWSFAMMRRLHGRSLAVADASLEEVGSALGEGLARLHALTSEAPGGYDPVTDAFQPEPPPYSERIVDRAHDWLRRCREASSETTDDDAVWIESVLDENRAAIDEPFAATYVHHDYKPNNVLGQRGPAGLRATGIVDLMEGYFGDPEEDLVRSVADLARSDVAATHRFVEAYRAARPLRPGHRERYRVYQLIDCLIIWEYARRNRVWFPEGFPFRRYAEQFILELDPF